MRSLVTILSCCALVGLGGSCFTSPEDLTPAEWLQQNSRLMEQLASYESKERHEAITRFKKLGRERGSQIAWVLLNDPKLENYRVEVVLARLLAEWRNRRAIPYLLRSLRVQDAGAVAIAKEGLEVFRGDDRAIRALEEMLDSEATSDRRIAAELLSKMGKDRGVELFMRRFKGEPDSEIRGHFLVTIAGSRHPQRTEFLVDALNDGDHDIRRYAWTLLRSGKDLPPGARFDPSGTPADRAQAVGRLKVWIRKTGSERS